MNTPALDLIPIENYPKLSRDMLIKEYDKLRSSAYHNAPGRAERCERINIELNNRLDLKGITVFQQNVNRRNARQQLLMKELTCTTTNA